MQDVAARYADRKRDSEQMAGGSTDDQPAAAAAASSTSEATDKSQAGITVRQPHCTEICSTLNGKTRRRAQIHCRMLLKHFKEKEVSDISLVHLRPSYIFCPQMVLWHRWRSRTQRSSLRSH